MIPSALVARLLARCQKLIAKRQKTADKISLSGTDIRGEEDSIAENVTGCERKSNREPLVAVQKGPTWFKK
jgi:hypothetical protein